jgi:iron complex outermembrane receptor protein
VYVNVPESYRAGIEVSGIVKISKKIDWQGNITASVNKIKNLIVYTDDWDTGIQRTDTFASSDISFSPSLIAASQIGYSAMKNLRFSLTGKFVGRQFIDNTSNWERQLHPYTVADVNIEYIVKPKFVKEVAFRLSLRNIFSAKYESNAWVYRFYSGGEHTVMDGYFPQAPLNVLGSLVVKF